MRTCEKSGGGRGILSRPGLSLGEAGADGATKAADGAAGGPKNGPSRRVAAAEALELRQAETVLARLLAGAEAKKPERRGRLPVGLTEPELQQGYSRVPHPVEVVAMGFLIACAAACAMGFWPWPLVAVRGLS